MVPTKSVTALVVGTGPQDCHEIGRVIVGRVGVTPGGDWRRLFPWIQIGLGFGECKLVIFWIRMGRFTMGFKNHHGIQKSPIFFVLPFGIICSDFFLKPWICLVGDFSLLT